MFLFAKLFIINLLAQTKEANVRNELGIMTARS